MSEDQWESREEDIDESGRDATQRQLDEEEQVENEPSPHQGEEGQDLV